MCLDSTSTASPSTSKTRRRRRRRRFFVLLCARAFRRVFEGLPFLALAERTLGPKKNNSTNKIKTEDYDANAAHQRNSWPKYNETCQIGLWGALVFVIQ